jgi:methionyl-tRNA formyltransferase
MKNIFKIKNLKNVVFLGANESLPQMIEINKKLNLKSFIITSKDQKKLISSKLKYFIFPSINLSFKNFILKNMKIENSIFISLSSRWIFTKKDINNFFKTQIINFHPSRLPLDSGGGGFSWRIMNNDKICNLLFHQINNEIDGGPILYSETSIFPYYCKIPKDYFDFQKEMTPIFYKKFISKLINGHEFKLFEQPSYLRTYFPRLDQKSNSWINWNMRDEELIRFINAFDDPYSGAQTKINNKIVSIKKAHLHGGEVTNHSFFSGIIIRKDKKFLVVATNSASVLLIEDVFNSKGNNIFNKLKVGDRFHTPSTLIDKSLNLRVYYGPNGKN